jgi:hypothetical protein
MLLWNNPVDELRSTRPHRSEPRWIQPGQRIHESAFELIGEAYTPLAIIRDGPEWGDAHQLRKKLMEPDLFSNAKILIDKLGEKSDVSEEDAQALLALLASGKRMLARCLLLLLLILTLLLNRC